MTRVPNPTHLEVLGMDNCTNRIQWLANGKMLMPKVMAMVQIDDDED